MADDIYQVMLMAKDCLEKSFCGALSEIDWIEPKEGHLLSVEEIFVCATFFKFRPSPDYRYAQQAAGGHKFPLGSIDDFPSVYGKYRDSPTFMHEVEDAIKRHQRGDWGDLSSGDWALNDAALFHEFRQLRPEYSHLRGALYSVYETTEGKLLIVTNRDRTRTEILFLNEYS